MMHGGIQLFILFNVLAAPSFGNMVEKFVKRGERVKLECSVQKAKMPVVTWWDKIFSESSSIDIYSVDRSRSNRNDAHPRIDSFVLDPTSLSLSISNMSDDFVGTYVCSSRVGNDVYNVSYTLATYSALDCSSIKSSYHTDQTLDFKCKIEFSGRSPELAVWRDNKMLERDDVEVFPSDDIEFLAYEYKHVLTPDDDKKIIGCRAVMDDIKEECNVTLNVTYQTKHVSFEPKVSNLTIGDTVTCKADGNPTPSLVLHDFGKNVTLHKGRGMVSIEILSDWQDTKVHLHCIAENKPGHPVSRNKHIYVSGPQSDGLTSSSEVIMTTLKLVLNSLFALLLSLILH